jgi:hypothetical protein
MDSSSGDNTDERKRRDNDSERSSGSQNHQQNHKRELCSRLRRTLIHGFMCACVMDVVNQIPRRNTSLISASNTVVLLLSKEIAED